MVKLRFANLNAELDGDPKEIVSILRDLGISNQATQSITPLAEAPKHIPSKENVESNDELFKKLPSIAEIVEMIEGAGKPFSFSLLGQQKRIFGKVISSRDNRPVYSKFYELHKDARNAIIKKHGGHWTQSNDSENKHHTTRYTWAADDDVKQQSEESKKQSLEQFEVKQE